MSLQRTMQIDIVLQDFQQAMECMASGKWDLAIRHGEDAVTKMREFQATDEPTETQKTLEV